MWQVSANLVGKQKSLREKTMKNDSFEKTAVKDKIIAFKLKVHMLQKVDYCYFPMDFHAFFDSYMINKWTRNENMTKSHFGKKKCFNFIYPHMPLNR